jgi:hypothetical protein
VVKIDICFWRVSGRQELNHDRIEIFAAELGMRGWMEINSLTQSQNPVYNFLILTLQASLVGHIDDSGFLEDGVAFLEFGAGKGKCELASTNSM